MKRALWFLVAASLLALTGCGRNVTAEPLPEATALPAATGEVSPVTPDEIINRMRNDPSGAVRLFAVNVGKGDALILRAGDYICLIDTGKTRARGRIESALTAMGANGGRLDAVFITHTDDDHTGGLRWLTDLAVENIYASAMYTGVKEAKHPAVKAAEQMGLQGVRWLSRGDAVSLGDTGATLRVLAPASLYEDKDDNNSLVMMLESDQGRILFTGDMELPEEGELMSLGDDLKCDVLKVANHGDDDTTGDGFARAAGAGLALISTDGQQKPGTPDPGVLSRLRAAGSRVLVTEDSDMGILITLSGGGVAAEYVVNDAPLVDGLYIARVDAGDDRILLGNRSGETVALSDFYLYSDKGDELFVFPDGASIEPGGTFTVGTQSTEGDCDIRWPDKKVVNKKKADTLCLYDKWGRLVDSMGNGQ